MTADPTPQRAVPVPDALWLEAQARANVQRDDLSQVIRDAPAEYVKRTVHTAAHGGTDEI